MTIALVKLDVLANSAAWQAAPERVRHAASEIWALDTALCQPGPAPVLLGDARAIQLASIEPGLEFSIAVGADEDSGLWLARRLFGADGDALVADLIGETANVFMGALTEIFVEHGVTFGRGLPEPIAIEALWSTPGACERDAVFCLKLTRAELRVQLRLRERGD